MNGWKHQNHCVNNQTFLKTLSSEFITLLLIKNIHYIRKKLLTKRKKVVLPSLTILYDHRSWFKFEVIHITWALFLHNTFSIMKNSIISTETAF